MIDAAELMGLLVYGGITTVTGVPCSYLTPVINRAICDPRVRYLAATHEGEAAAIAAGAWLGGGLGCAIGRITTPLLDLMAKWSRCSLLPVGIPALGTSRCSSCCRSRFLLGWRGQGIGVSAITGPSLLGRYSCGAIDGTAIGA